MARQCVMTPNCTVYCEMGGEYFEVMREDPEYPPEFLERLERCLVATGATCVDNAEAYAQTKAKLRTTDETMRALLDRVSAAVGIDGVRFVSVLGAGVHGVAVLVCNDAFRKKGFVVKFNIDPSLTREQWDQEAKQQWRFATLGLAPQVLAHEFLPEHSFIVMDRLAGGMLGTLMRNPMTEQDIVTVYAKFMELIELMCFRKLVHQDLHFGNIGYANDIPDTGPIPWHALQLQLIDFGLAMNGKCDTKVDLASLVRGSFTKNPNIERLGDLLAGEFLRRYGMPSDFVHDFDSWDAMYVDMLNANTGGRYRTQLAERAALTPSRVPLPPGTLQASPPRTLQASPPRTRLPRRRQAPPYRVLR